MSPQPGGVPCRAQQLDEGSQLALWSAVASQAVQQQLSNPLFRAVMDASHSAFLVLGRDRRIAYANRAMSELTGYSLAELTALRSSAALNPPEDHEPSLDALRRAFAGHPSPEPRRREIVRRDGTRTPVVAAAHPLVIEGEVVALVVELSDRSREEAALQRVHAQARALTAANAELEVYREMVARASDAILILVDERVVVRNQSYRRRLGLDVLGHSLADLLDGEALAEARAAVGRIERGESEAERVLLPVVTARGEVIEMEATLSPIDLAGDHAVLAVVRDVSERLALERHMQVRERLDALSRVSAGAAHELANTLGSLIGALPPDAPWELSDAVERARRLAAGLALVGGQEVGRTKAVQVRPLVRAAIAALPRALQDRVTIRQTGRGSAGSINGRHDDLVVALSALLMNALEADESAQIHLSTVVGLPDGAQPEEPCPEGYCLIEISDAGPGMSPAAVSRLFEPFYTTKPGRTGLGASLAFSVIRAHGGQTVAASVEGEGTTIRVAIPRRAASRGRGPKRRTTPQPVGGRRVLLADDNEALRAVTAAILRGAGFEVTEARSSEEARAVLDAPLGAATADALVLDMQLGDGTGLEIFEAAGGSPAAPPTLFISGYSGDELSELAASDRWRFLMKPFGRDELLQELETVVGAR